MSSGKQVSFAFGEVSPEWAARTDAALYPQALKTLYNGLVKKSGGTPNRPGTKWMATSLYQENLTVSDGKVGVRLFPFYTPENDFFLIELKDRLSAADVAPGGTVLRAYRVTQGVITDYYPVVVTFDFRTENEVYDLARASYSQLNDSMTICVPCSLSTDTPLDARYKTFIISYTIIGVTPFSYTSLFPKPVRIGTPSAAAVTIDCYGTPELLLAPVTYTIMQELDDGSEVLWRTMSFDKCNPNLECQSKLTSIDVPVAVGVKQYNVYRSAGQVSGSHAFLVGRIAPQAAAFIFQDFIAEPDITIQPPIDEYLYPIETVATTPSLIQSSQHIKHLFYYKSRAVLVYHPYKVYDGVSKYYYKYSPGQFGLSKVGAPKMFGRPLTPNAIDAFSATIPQDKIGDITNYLVINRLVLFTKDVAVMIRGGEAGILTPQTVNPEVIYNEGSADDITPVASGTRGFFVTPDKSKLVMIRYSTDEALAVAEVSAYSAHLFDPRDIRCMAMVPGQDNVLWLLKRNGQLISLSISDEGTVQAFSRHETDGFIEDITSMEMFRENYAELTTDYKNKRAYCLILSVLRNGVRQYESMAVRNDIKYSNFLFADSAVFFGSPYSNKTRALNITTTTDYLGGSELTITDLLSAGTLSTSYPVGSMLVFKYPGENNIGEMQLRIMITAITSTNVIKGTAEEDVPAYLQNVQAQALTSAQKLARQQNYLRARNQVTGLTHLAGKEVSVYADQVMVSSPWNPEADTLVVSNTGVLDLPYWYTWGYVGLPYYFEMESLSLDASDARTFTDKGKLINSSGVAVSRTIGGLIGSRDNNQEPTFETIIKREQYGNTTPTEVVTGVRNIPFPASWNDKGSIVIRQVDPLPITVLSIYPKGVIGD